ncbi:hypothetical protein KQX64_03325 [Rhodopseudomonas palustris]|nr:hypothetical protein KQX64_03325 [Rhodopseudomonas palustris]
MDDLYKAKRGVERARGEQAYHLAVFGDTLAKRKGYKEHSGIDAVHYYLVQKHNWLPSVVRAMNTDDLVFCLEEEMSGWVLPESARPER